MQEVARMCNAVIMATRKGVRVSFALLFRDAHGMAGPSIVLCSLSLALRAFWQSNCMVLRKTQFLGWGYHQYLVDTSSH